MYNIDIGGDVEARLKDLLAEKAGQIDIEIVQMYAGSCAFVRQSNAGQQPSLYRSATQLFHPQKGIAP